MTTRSTLLGCLASVLVLPGCFEEPLPDPAATETGGDATESATTTSTDPSATSLGSATDSADSGSTSVSVTTIEPPMETGSESTTSEGTATDESTGPGDPCEPVCAGLACGDQEMCSCGECNAMATCSDDQSYCGLPVGFYNVFADQTQVFGEVQLGFRFQIFENRTVRRLGAIAGGAGAEVRMALYGHDGNGPSNRIVQTGAVMLYAEGNNEFDVGATALAPGDYWVMLHTNGPAPLRRTPNLDNNYEIAVRGGIPFGDGFPMDMNDEMVLMDYRYNLYMVVED